MQEVVTVAACSQLQRAIDIVDADSHVKIILEQGSTADIIIRIHGKASVCNHLTEVSIGAEAVCTVLTVNAAKSDAVVSIKQSGSIGEGGSLKWQNVTLGGADVSHDVVSKAVGNDSESAIDWMFYAKGDERQVLTARNIFEGLRGGGEVLMRGVAEGKAHATAKGMIEIGEKGNGTNTYLTQQVLMLDLSAKVDAVPGLEIKTNDVKASHSATVARVTPEDLFYFAARGISTHEARAMFVQGFLGEITARIEHQNNRELVSQMIGEKYAL